MAIHLVRRHSRFLCRARSPPCMVMGSYRRIATTTSSGTRSPLSSQRRLGFVSWSYSDTSGRHHKSLAAVYALLEERLPVAPLSPNDALDTLLFLLPADAHHSGVVDHLVRIVSGNVCCTDPSLCLAVMERLLTPQLPRWLPGSAAAAENSSDIDDSPSVNANDAAVLMALVPLAPVLSRCVVVHVRLRLVESGSNTDPLCSLHDRQTPHADPLRRGTPHDSRTGDDSRSSFLLRGAAVLLSFTAQRQHWDCSDCERSAVMDSCTKQYLKQRESRDRWHACSLIAVAYPVVQYFYSSQSQANERKALAARTDISTSFPAAAAVALQPSLSSCCATPGGRCASGSSCWSTVRSLGQQCWWWSTVVCRATPAIPSAAVRAFAAYSLVEVLHKLHRALGQCVVPREPSLLWACSKHPPQLLSLETLRPCLAMLEWLLVNSVPILRDESDADASWLSPAYSKESVQSSQPSAWTTELRHGWRHLGGDFAYLSATALKRMANDPGAVSDVCGGRAAAVGAPGESTSAARLAASPPPRLSSTGVCARSHLVRAMANVGYRLALQWTAAVTPLVTAVAVSKLVKGTLDGQFRPNPLQQLGPLDKHQHQELNRMPPACELEVVLRLLRAITSLRPVLSSTASTMNSGLPAAAGVVFVEEATWCKLACIVNLVRCCSAGREENNDCLHGALSAVTAMHEHQKFVQLHEQRLLHCGLVHTLACAASSTLETASCVSGDAIVNQYAAGAGHAGPNPQPPAHVPLHALPNASIEFLSALLKCWRTWTMDWPLQLYATWLQGLASAAPAVASPVGAGVEGADVRDSSGGTSLTIGEAAAHVWSSMAVLHFPLLDTTDARFVQQCQSMQHRLCSHLTEAWAAAMDVRHDRDPLDLCACWYAFSAASRPPRCPSAAGVSLTTRGGALPSTRCTSSQLSQQCSYVCQRPREDGLREQLSLIAATSEDRFCCMCEKWFKQLRDLPNPRVMSAILQSREQRPMALDQVSVEHQKRDLLRLGWCLMCFPAILSHVALRVLYRSRPEGPAGATSATLDDNGVAAELPRISDSFVALIRSAALTPATEELTAFQLSVVSRYVDWCEAAGVHIGWCACAVQAHRTVVSAGASDVSCIAVDTLVEPPANVGGMPWWVLTVEGLAVKGSLQDSVKVDTILFLWEHGVGAATAAAAAAAAGVEPPRFFESHHHHHSECASAIRPLMPPRLGTLGNSAVEDSSEGSPSELGLGTPGAPPEATAEFDKEVDGCDDFSSEHWSLRRSIVEWGHRYALRLVLFEVVEGQWHRSRGAALARRSQQRQAEQVLCDARHQRCRTLLEVREDDDARTADGARVVDYATSACRSAVLGLGIPPGFVWNSEAYQPLLQLVAESAVRMVEEIAAEVLAVACATVAHSEANDSKSTTDEPEIEGPPAVGAIVTNLVKAKHPEQWTERLTAHLWRELRRSPAQVTIAQPSCTFPGAHCTGLHGGHHRSSPTAATHYAFCRHTQPRGLASSDAVACLEQLLCDLGLVEASERHLACHTPCGTMSTAEVAEESHALLASLLLSPELVCTSSMVVYFASAVLWPRCWASLLKTTSAGVHHNGTGMLGSLEGEEDVATQLDALVAFRVILRCVERVQRLVRELGEYLCCVFVPAVRAGHCVAWLTATPVEAICRMLSSSASCSATSLTTHPESTMTAKHNRRDAGKLRRHFRFSSATVRTFEVLCLGRCGDERRAPRVWQQWTHELVCTDGMLREHPLIRSPSR
ncbi:hypothetical protein, conserved [Leishmania lindenbergi]|uniref:Non-specific serine/threonine protein kinase n=1 Tax=Leishmania lindenbergi TaxID=651832 RepID=A0AAW3AAT5_9TRYP